MIASWDHSDKTASVDGASPEKGLALAGLTKLFLTLWIFLAPHMGWAQEPKIILRVYGTEGPVEPLREAADVFGAINNVDVRITAAPVDKWKAQAQKDADLIYSSSENIMDFYNDVLGLIDDKTITSLYLRPAAILVRPGNPQKIKGLRDFVHRDLKIVIINGQGQVAMWEDIVGRLKDVNDLNQFREHIAFTARSIGEAVTYWKNHEEVPAWLSFHTTARREDVKADVVPIEKDLVVYRSMGAAVSTTSHQRETALKFIEFLKSNEAEKIFKTKGWFKKEK